MLKVFYVRKSPVSCGHINLKLRARYDVDFFIRYTGMSNYGFDPDFDNHWKSETANWSWCII